MTFVSAIIVLLLAAGLATSGVGFAFKWWPVVGGGVLMVTVAVLTAGGFWFAGSYGV